MAYNYPSGMIAIFDTSCPSGWTRVSAWDNKYLMGNSTYGTTGGSSTHTHSCNPGAYLGDTGGTGPKSVGGFYDDVVRFSHMHYIDYPATNTSSTSNDPPFINVIFCKKD